MMKDVAVTGLAQSNDSPTPRGRWARRSRQGRLDRPRMGRRRGRPLLRAVIELLNAANGLRPLTRNGVLTIPVFMFGWTTSEMTPLYLAGSTLDALRRGLRGDFHGRRGRIALALTALTWGMLCLIHRRNVGSEAHFEAPLREALKDQYAAIADRTQPVKWWRHVGLPPSDRIRRRYVEKAATVQYGPHPQVNLADIWRRGDLPREGRAPVLLQVPGGDWVFGKRRPQSYPMLARMAESGWVCVSIDYRVSPKHAWPDHIVDVKRALAWIKQNIADFGGDPDFVAITGGSAGGHLSALAALTPNDPQYQPGFEDVDTSVAAAVPIYGRYDWVSSKGTGRRAFMTFLEKVVVKHPFKGQEHIYTQASPIKRVTPTAPPFFIMHGQHDTPFPEPEAREFSDALRAVSTSTVAYAEIPHAQHAFDFYDSPRAHYCAQAVERFLSWVHASKEETP